jgi:hypothetical protein
MTIYEIKRLTATTSPYFFSRDTLRFFGQTLRSFSVTRQTDGRYRIAADMRDRFSGRHMGVTERFYNPATHELERS